MCWFHAGSAQSYQIGDLYTSPDGSQGVVYYVYSDGSGGWIVALNDASASCTWGTNVDVPNLTNVSQSPSYWQHYYLELLNDTAGFTNTQKINHYLSSSTNIAANVVDTIHGWFLPSAAQLSVLYSQLPFISASMMNYGGTVLSYGMYWSSTECDESNAWAVDFGSTYSSGQFECYAKTSSCYVRPVRCFNTTTTVVYDTTLAYLWNTGSTQPYINVSPYQTITYAVTATSDYGCSNSAEQTIIVGGGSPQTLYDTICQGTDYEKNGFVFSSIETDTLGIHTQTRTLTTNNCTSTVTLELMVQPADTTFLTHTACENYNWNGVTYYESGTYTQYFNNRVGCDSVVTLTLTLDMPSDSTLNVTVLENDLPYVLNGEEYTNSGTYYQHLTNTAGCENTTTINLTVFYNITTTVDSTVCESELPVIWNGITCDSSATYTFTQTSMIGADSIVFLNLTVNALSDSTLNVSVLENDLPYISNGEQYTSSGTYYQHLTNAANCDSNLTVNLTVIYNVSQIVDTIVCAANLPYTWHGYTFVTAGNHTDTLHTSNNADSVVTYQLIVDELTATIGNVTHITCYGDSTGSATVTVTGGTSPMSYLWTNTAGSEISTTTVTNNLPAGSYTFTVSDSLGCTSTATVILNSLTSELIPGEIAADQIICAGELTAEFTGTPASGGDNCSYQWQISTNGTDWTNAPGACNLQNYSYLNPVSVNFSLRRAWVSQNCGTVYSNTVTVDVWPNSSDTITADVCNGEPYQEHGFDISTEQTAAAGEYLFEQHYATGQCDSAVILILTVHPMYFETIGVEICEGDGYNSLGFGILPQETIDVDSLQRTLILQSANGCDSVIVLNLTVIDTMLKIVSLTQDYCEEMSAELQVITEMPNYIWSTGENSPNITVTSPGIYSVSASQGDCHNSTSAQIEGCQNELYLPNAITPSKGEGLNDYFSIPEVNQRNMYTFEISIFNRWGEMVFYSTDKNFKWYGEYKGKTMYQTVYNYIINYTDAFGKPHRVTGSIVVL